MLVAGILAVLVALAWPAAAGADPSPRARKIAADFVAKHCPSFDPAAMDELAAIFQRTINQRIHNGRVQIMPIQRYAGAMEVATLSEWCKRPGLRQIRALNAPQGAKTPDFQADFDGQEKPVCIEVVSVTGRFPRPWQYRSTARSRLGYRPPTEADVERALDTKIGNGQLTSPQCPDGGTISLNVNERRDAQGRPTNSWKPISKALKNRAGEIERAQHVKSVEIRSGSTRVDVVRNAAGKPAVVARPDIGPGYQRALGAVRGALPVIDEGGARGAPLRAPGLTPRGGGFANAISRGLGGIDFSSLELRYVSDRKGRGIQYAFRGVPGTSTTGQELGAAQDASDAFFVWLALNPGQFWVNLNPTEPDRIIDPVFARSDAGRVLLEADLAMKKSVAPLVRPDTGPGVEFWHELDALYGDHPELACMSARQWIVPAPATVYTDRDELYILDAPLDVKMESEFVGGFPNGGCPNHDQAFEARKEEIYKRLILPLVVHEVNTAPEFADLRRVYLSRVAAEWFRARHYGDHTPIGRIAASGDIHRWRSMVAWDPMAVFNAFLQSVQHGEWTVDRPVVINGQTYLLPQMMGGVDFTRTPVHRVNRRQFRTHWRKLAHRIQRSLHRPTTDPQGEVWLGGRAG